MQCERGLNKSDKNQALHGNNFVGNEDIKWIFFCCQRQQDTYLLVLPKLAALSGRGKHSFGFSLSL